VKAIAAQEGFIGGLFKSDAEKVETFKKEALSKLNAKIQERAPHLEETCKEALAHIAVYRDGMKELSSFVQGKKFDTKAFADLQTAHDITYTYHVIDAGINHIDDVKKFMDGYFQYYFEKRPNPPTEMDLHKVNSAYIDSDFYVGTPADFLSGSELFPYYAVPKGTLFTKAGYSPAFVTDTIRSVSRTLSSIQTIIDTTHELPKFAQFLQTRINTPASSASDYHNKVKLVSSDYNDISAMIQTAIRSVSQYYLKETVSIAKYIADHCYK
jgi:hypothetical protein